MLPDLTNPCVGLSRSGTQQVRARAPGPPPAASRAERDARCLCSLRFTGRRPETRGPAASGQRDEAAERVCGQSCSTQDTGPGHGCERGAAPQRQSPGTCAQRQPPTEAWETLSKVPESTTTPRVCHLHAAGASQTDRLPSSSLWVLPGGRASGPQERAAQAPTGLRWHTPLGSPAVLGSWEHVLGPWEDAAPGVEQVPPVHRDCMEGCWGLKEKAASTIEDPGRHRQPRLAPG